MTVTLVGGYLTTMTNMPPVSLAGLERTRDPLPRRAYAPRKGLRSGRLPSFGEHWGKGLQRVAPILLQYLFDSFLFALHHFNVRRLHRGQDRAVQLMLKLISHVVRFVAAKKEEDTSLMGMARSLRVAAVSLVLGPSLLLLPSRS
jgi:hypothetical protein